MNKCLSLLAFLAACSTSTPNNGVQYAPAPDGSTSEVSADGAYYHTETLCKPDKTFCADSLHPAKCTHSGNDYIIEDTCNPSQNMVCSPDCEMMDGGYVACCRWHKP